MATDNRKEIMWATFAADSRISSQTSTQRAIVRSESTKLYAGFIHGVLHLIIEDSSLPHPGTIPWANLSGIGWVETPDIEFITTTPTPAPNRGRFVAKPKAEDAA